MIGKQEQGVTKLLALKTEEWITRQGIRRPLEAGKSPGIEPPEGTQPCQPLDFSPVRPMSNVHPIEP